VSLATAHSLLLRIDMKTLVSVLLAGLTTIVCAADSAPNSGPKWTVGTPIVTYWAGPQMSDVVAKQMADGGFNLVWCGEKELDVAARHHLRAQLQDPLLSPVAAVSVGIVSGQPMLDLCYTEDVAAAVDLNLVMNGAGEFIELQGTGEEATFTETQLAGLLTLGKAGIRDLIANQAAAISNP